MIRYVFGSEWLFGVVIFSVFWEEVAVLGNKLAKR